MGYTTLFHLEIRRKFVNFAFMRRQSTYLISFIAAAAILLFGCGRHDSSSPLRWASVDKTADSISAAMDREFNDSMRLEVIEHQFALLDSVSKLVRHPLLDARVLYWQACMTRDDSLRTKRFADGIALIDKDRYPYDWARLMEEYTHYNDDMTSEDKYRNYKEAVKIFEEVNDSMWIMQTHNELARVLAATYNDEMSLLEMEKSAAYCNQPQNRYIIQCNIAQTIYDLGMKDKALAMVDSLLKSGFVCEYSHVTAKLYQIRYKEKHKIQDAMESYRLMTVNPESYAVRHSNHIANAAAYVADYYIKAGIADSAFKYADIMHSKLNPDFAWDLEYTLTDARLYEMAGMKDSFDIRMHQYNTEKQALEQRRRTAIISNEEVNAQIAQIDREMESDRGLPRVWIWIFGGMAVIVIGLSVYLGMMARLRSHTKEKRDLETNLLHQTRRVTAHEIKELAMTGDLDLEKFTLLFGELHPLFIGRLKQRHPELTMGDTRLASFIYLGLDTKHIARLLSINPDSVKKNRQRLRAKLGLTPDISVVEYLSKMMRDD